MLDIFSSIQSWKKDNKSFAIATVIKTWGSAPRMVGASLAVSEEQEMIGSVSGGCVEGDVVKAAMDVLSSGKPKNLSYGVADEEAWELGLSCGGELHVFLEPYPGYENNEEIIWDKLAEAYKSKRGCVLLSKMDGEKSQHVLVYSDGEMVGEIKDFWKEKAILAYNQRKDQIIESEGERWFAHVFPGPSVLLIIGATHLTADLVKLAHMYSFETHVIDPRGIFAGKTVFKESPTHLYDKWPAEVMEEMKLDAFTFAVLLTHDPKIDDQALHILLQSDVGYIGALGGRKTQTKRKARMKDAGYSDEVIEKIHGPVGVDINAKRPSEIALSIMAEIIK